MSPTTLNALSHPVKIRIVLVSFRFQAVGSARSSVPGGICSSCYVGIFHGCCKNGRCRWNISDIAYRAIGPPPVSFLKMLFRLHCWSNFFPNTLAEYLHWKGLMQHKQAKAKKSKDQLLTLLSNKTSQNIATNGKDHIRAIREEQLNDTYIISVFDSALSRAIGIEEDTLTHALIVVQVYYLDIFKDISFYGFTYRGQKYQYYTSSAGQIRKKKAVFIQEFACLCCINPFQCRYSARVFGAFWTYFFPGISVLCPFGQLFFKCFKSSGENPDCFSFFSVSSSWFRVDEPVDENNILPNNVSH